MRIGYREQMCVCAGGGGGGGGGAYWFQGGSRRRRDSLYPLYFLNQWVDFTILAWIQRWDKPKG